MVVFHALPVHNSESLLHAAIYLFSHTTVMHMRPKDHVPYIALASKWLIFLCVYLACLHIILGALIE